MPDSYVSSMGSAFTETGYPPTADRDGDRKLARLRTRRVAPVEIHDRRNSRQARVEPVDLDTAKHVFQVHGVDENEQTVVRRQLRCSEMGKFFTKLAPTRIGLEACGASHYWARLLHGLGHEVVLLPPQYIKP